MPSDVQEGWGNRTSTDAEVTGDVDATVIGVGIITYFKKTSIASAPTGETTIVSAPFITGVFEFFVLGYGSADNGYALYRLKKNGVTMLELPTGPGYWTPFDFKGAPISITTGDTITITGEHTTGTRNYSATVFGYV